MVLAGCSTTAQPSGPYAAEYAAAIQAAKSDYVRQILQSGHITTADMKDTEQHVVTCMKAAGIGASYVTDEWGIDGLQIVGALNSAQELAQKQCSEQWMGPIAALYINQYTNPNNEDWNGLIAACLVRKGLVPAGFTGQDYASLVNQYGTRMDSSTMTPDENGIITQTMAPSPPMALPGGVTLSDPAALACTVVPLQ